MPSNVVPFPGARRPGSADPPPGGPRWDLPRLPTRHPAVLSWPWACVAGYLGGIAVTTLLTLEGGTRHVGFDLAAFAVLAAVIGWWSRPAGGACAAVIGWLFFDGFLAGRHAQLSWHPASAGQIGMLAAVAVVASALRYLTAHLRDRLPTP